MKGKKTRYLHRNVPEDRFFSWMEQRYDHYCQACQRVGEPVRPFAAFIRQVEPERCDFFIGRE